ncbi:hypothetical protein BpPP18_32390 [Weizmannia acidilactici]|nr:hypothetical protein BpPP18_32390 [Weizmannia acidilactici]
MNQDFSTTTINEKWVTDITYIHTLKEGWYNRKRIHSCLGYMAPQEVEDRIKGAS